MSLSFSECDEMITEIDHFGKNLKEWDKGFIADLLDYPVGYYSPKQQKHIERIHEYAFD